MSPKAADPNASTHAPRAPAHGRAAAILVGLGVVALVAAGVLLWAAQGPAVFEEVVIAALAWCF